jgi:hypothetical protein
MVRIVSLSGNSNSDPQPLNEDSMIAEMLFAPITVVRELQPSKTDASSVTTPSGMRTLLNELQPLNARSPISVTESGISTLRSWTHPSNALALISVTPEQISTRPWQGNSGPSEQTIGDQISNVSRCSEPDVKSWQ